jgi:serine/threonine protein kinase
MAWWKVLLRCVGEAVCNQGLRALVGAVPFGEVICNVAGDALERWRRHQHRIEDRECLEQAARAAIDEVKEEAWAVVREVCGDQPEPVQAQAAGYLMQVPSLIRQTLKRPADPAGLSAPISLSLQKPEDLLLFLPQRLPHFRPGDRPPGIGDWELVDLLGIGGFGEVWKARHRYFDGIAPAALKFCLDSAARERLLKYEAGVLNQVMRQGRHPGFVPLLDAFLSSDPPCLKYEYIEGGDLSGVAREWHALPLAERWQPATRLLARLAAIVGFAHRLNPPIVHRDLKPANVLVQRTAEGDWLLRVTDFGIGSVAALPALRESRQGTTTRGEQMATALRGAHTPLYASPQQVRGDPPDVRDDIHALGVMWYQLLIGDLVSGAPTGLWADELEEAGLSRDLIRLLGACVAARAEKRPADAAKLAEQLNELLDRPSPPPTPTAPEPARPAPPPVKVAPEPPGVAEMKALFEANPHSWLLDLTNKRIGDKGVKLLAGLPSLAHRSVLYLSGNQISDEGVKVLAASPHLTSLTRLILWDNLIGDEGALALANSPHLSNLNVLDIGRNHVGDAGVEALAVSPFLVNLNALILVSNRIGDKGALALANSETLANLAELKPLDNRISAVGASALKERFGKRVRIY